MTTNAARKPGGQPRYVPEELLDLWSRFSKLRKANPLRAAEALSRACNWMEAHNKADDKALQRYVAGELPEGSE